MKSIKRVTITLLVLVLTFEIISTTEVCTNDELMEVSVVDDIEVTYID